MVRIPYTYLNLPHRHPQECTHQINSDGLSMDQVRGQDLKKAFSAATSCLEEYRDAINALNVFPVPDGDTGTNMLLTMRSAVRSADSECPDDEEHSAGTVSSALASGAFFGARGNSGVILSQILKGFSDALDGREYLTANEVEPAFRLAYSSAYRSVGNPVEGTILSVIKGASEALKDIQTEVWSMLGTAYQAAQDALELTPQQLPILKEAGVVDAGGLGVVVLIGGLFQSIAQNGPTQASDLVDLTDLSRFCGTNDGATKTDYLDATVEQEWGFCTQFIISKANEQDLNLSQVRRYFQETALSTVVVGDEQNIRVHIHVEDTGPALSYAESLGSLSEVKIEDMDSQNAEFASNESSETLALALLPVVQGEGLARLFMDSGCPGVIEGGQTMNPSVQQIMGAARRTGAKDVIVLPNNRNIISAADQSAVSDSSIHVIPTKSVPQGVSALLVFNPEAPWQDNVEAMTASLTEVTSMEVAVAIRSTKIDGIEVREGQYVGLLEGKLVVADNTAEQALKSTLILAGLSTDAIVTIYYGIDKNYVDARFVASELENEFPGNQVDIIEGGQPHHQYLASIE